MDEEDEVLASNEGSEEVRSIYLRALCTLTKTGGHDDDSLFGSPVAAAVSSRSSQSLSLKSFGYQ